MSLLAGFFFAAVLAAVLLATIAIWAPRRTVPRAAAVVLAVTLIPAGYVALTEILGRPKPVAHEWWSGQATDRGPPRHHRRRGPGDLPLGAARRRETAPLLRAPVAKEGGREHPGGHRRSDADPGTHRDQGLLLEAGLGRARGRQHGHRSAERAPAQASPAARPGLRPEGQRHLRPSDPAAPRANGALARWRGGVCGIYSRRSEEAKVGEHDEDHPGSIP